MESLKLLIVDDVEDNRLVLWAICRKLEGFEIFEAVDGQDAVEQCETLRPHIILMDIMMPRMNGFEASKIIKTRFPETIIMAITAVIDVTMEEKMTALGVAAYIRKPIDKELIRLKIKSYAAVLTSKGREKDFITDDMVINPFSNEIRNFKTIFTISNIEGIMDLGVWLLWRFECSTKNVCSNIDIIIELLYALINGEVQNDLAVKVTIEESFSEMFIHAALPKPLKHTLIVNHLIGMLADTCVITDTMAAFRITLLTSKNENSEKNLVTGILDTSASLSQTHQKTEISEALIEPTKPLPSVQDVRSLGAVEHQVLRESFVHKITAEEYIGSIDSDVYGEVHDLKKAALEWESWMYTLQVEGNEANFHHFANEVLGAYSSAISALTEFSGLAYAIISLSTLIKANAGVLASDEGKREKALLFLEGFKNDISSWIDHVFELQDAQDIHYLDGSFFSSCMLIESIVTDTQIDIGKEGEIEFF